MASGLLALFDDVTVLFDDIAAMSKVATKKTAGILGDDLAVAAEQSSGYAASRELPVLWRITKGSFLNKAIILPFAFLLSYFAPWLIDIVLVLGALYLAFEGAEKVFEWIGLVRHEKQLKTSDTSNVRALEDARVKSAIRTDFILSVEIIIIALSSVSDQPLIVKIAATTFVAVLATIGVYGIVALLVRMDDVGFALAKSARSQEHFKAKLGLTMVKALPKIIRIIGIVGTIALLLVAGGIMLHQFHALEEIFGKLPGLIADLIVGLLTGLTVFIPVWLFHTLRRA